MDTHTRDIFRVNISQKSTGDTSLETPSRELSPSFINFEKQIEPSERNNNNNNNNNSWRVKGLSQKQQEQKQKEQEREKMPTHTLFNSPTSSIRENSLSTIIINSHPPSPPRVRPTSELPPTRDIKEVLYSAPIAMKAEENINHDIIITPKLQSSSLYTQSNMTPIGKKETLETSSTTLSPAINPPVSSLVVEESNMTLDKVSIPRTAISITSPVHSKEENIPVRITTCRVCSLCGVSVVLVGTFIEHQTLWKEHVNSWAHQRNYQILLASSSNHSSLQNDFISSSTTKKIKKHKFGVSPPLSPTFIRALEEITASPVLLGTEYTSMEIASPPSPNNNSNAKFKTIINTPEQTPSSKKKMRRNTATPNDSLLRGCEKLIFDADRQSSFSDDNEEEEEEEEEEENKELEKYNNNQDVLKSQQNIGETKRTSQMESKYEETENKFRGDNRRKREDQTISGSEGVNSSVSSSISLKKRKEKKKKEKKENEELIRKKERQLERTLSKFIIKKEKKELLIYLRRWFNKMFVRVIDDSSSFSRDISIVRIKTQGKPIEKKEIESIEAATPIIDVKNNQENEISGNAIKTEKIENTSANENSQNKDKQEKKQFKKQKNKKLKNNDLELEAPFMESCVKDFGHYLNNSSSSSIEMEVAKTDVSWYLHRSTNPPDNPENIKSDKEENSNSYSLENDTSIEEILLTLTTPLQERIRAALRGESTRISAFPKTSEVLSQLRSSILAATVTTTAPVTPQSHSINSNSNSLYWSPGVSNNINVREIERKIIGESCRSTSSSPAAHTNSNNNSRRSESEEIATQGRQDWRASLASMSSNNREQTSYELQIQERINNTGEIGSIHREESRDNDKELRTTREDNRKSSQKEITEISLPKSSDKKLGYTAIHASSQNSNEEFIEGDQITLNEVQQKEKQEHSSFHQHPIISLDTHLLQDIESHKSYTSESSLTLRHQQRKEKEEKEKLDIIRRRRRRSKSSTISTNNSSIPGLKKNKELQRQFKKCESEISSENFKGIPGEYYCYMNGYYHHVMDPTSEIYSDTFGRRLPIYFVRRTNSSSSSINNNSPSRRRSSLFLTRPQSPLGPGRVNPYCTVCVAKYKLIIVDENMQPTTVTPQRLRGSLIDGKHAENCNGGNSRTRTQSPANREQQQQIQLKQQIQILQKRQQPLLQPPHRIISHKNETRCFSDTASVPRKTSSTITPHNNNINNNNDNNKTNVEINDENMQSYSDAGHRGVLQKNISPQEEEWLRRQERRLRRRMKNLLWRELPKSRGSQQWVEYLTSLKEIMQMLETLRVGGIRVGGSE